MKPSHNITSLLKGGSILLSIAICVFLLYYAFKIGTESPTEQYVKVKLKRESEVLSRRHLNLEDPNEAPKNLRHYAELGYKIMVDTQTYAKEYVGDRLNCTNCHFAAGDTTGGIQSGLSLAGVATKFPTYDKRFGKVITIETRINSCFMRSMNGKPLPLDSEEMLALVVYFHWISTDLPIYVPIPWLGSKPLSYKEKGNSEKGKVVYTTYCALCHHTDGQGGFNNPPVWGHGSFNKEAGFNNEDALSSFIYWNMPYADSTPVLTEEQARDVAAYVLSQPRD